ncbi:MAG TPA: cytochrome c-type biogenesis protein [Caulobacteraceae bacterium]|jgi:cytochrome c-type biogenesis protein CcmH
MPPLRRAIVALVAVVMLGAAAADPADRLADPAKETRARELFRDVRCLVCQSQSIDESDAPLAHDLRQLVREQVSAGRSDDQIRDFLVSRYGQFVLLSPKASLGNAVLWLGPLLVVVVGAGVLFSRRAANETAALDDQEEAALQRLSREETK